LEALVRSDVRVTYEPSQFPAVIFWPSRLRGAVVSIFSTGKIVVSGLKNSQHVGDAVEVLEEVLSKIHYKDRAREGVVEQRAYAPKRLQLEPRNQA